MNDRGGTVPDPLVPPKQKTASIAQTTKATPLLSRDLTGIAGKEAPIVAPVQAQAGLTARNASPAATPPTGAR